MDAKSKYSGLYKTRDTNNDDNQEERRRTLLEKFKRQRQELVDDKRHIKEFIKNLKKKKYNNEKYKDQLQISEWLKEKPDDIENWFLVPCPKGKHCLVVAEGGSTKVYSKRGVYMFQLQSMLPGDGKMQQQTTILDCIYNKKLEKFYVLDAIAFGNHDLINCDTAFRFFWMKSQLAENNLDEASDLNEYPFVATEFYDMSDDEAAQSCFAKYPQWENDSPQLDGLLFYHKDSSYVQGPTPLVGWLLPFMVPEVLGCSVNDEYMQLKPKDYIDYLHFIVLFDENETKKFNKRNRVSDQSKMDDETVTESEISELNELDAFNVLENSRRLEIDEGLSLDVHDYVACS